MCHILFSSISQQVWGVVYLYQGFTRASCEINERPHTFFVFTLVFEVGTILCLMKRIIVLLISFCTLVSCEFDDSVIWDKLDDHEERIQGLEVLCRQMNTNIESLQTILTALQQNDYVTGVAPIVEGKNVVGYTIIFSKNGSVTIYHGEDGNDGSDGHTPKIGVRQDSDGIWYWTIDGEWLLDDYDNKVRAVGADGNDGSDGTDGITPELKIESGYWYVSYDGGSTWTKLGKAVGEDGTSGENGDSFFKDVFLNEEEVVFILADGAEIKVPMRSSLNMTLDTYDLVCSYCQTFKVGYSIVGPDLPIDLVVFSEGGYFTAIEEECANSGKIVIKTDMSSKEGKIIVMASCDGNTVVKAVSVVISASASDDYIDEYGINHGAGVEIDGVIWAPVNCGYKSSSKESKGYPYGKLYQWGRKYGQGYSLEFDDAESVVIEGPVSLEIGQSEFYSSYYFLSLSRNWLDCKIPELWNLGTEEKPVKSIYDPCPKNWRVPTSSEMESLITHKSEWIDNNQSNGYWFYGSSDGNDGVFLPASGYISQGIAGGRGTVGAYWTSMQKSSLDFRSSFVRMDEYALSEAYSIRCVRESSMIAVPITGLSLNKSNVELVEGQTFELDAILSPSSATGIVNWVSDKPSVASVEDGIITANSPGKAIISATIGSLSAQCEVTVIEKITTGTEKGYEWVDLGLPSGVKWATCNVGATSPSGYGTFYSWAETSPKFDYSMGTYFMATNSPFGVTYNPFHVGDIAGTEYDAATQNWGGKWQMPSRDDAQELIDNCKMEWTEKSGTYGYVFIGPNGNSIFMVAAGSRSSSNDSGAGEGEYGSYWTSNCCGGNVGDAVYIYFQSNYTPYVKEGSNYSKGKGRSIRAIIK